MKRINTICWILVLCGCSSADYLTDLEQYATPDWDTAAAATAAGYIGCRFSRVLCSYDENCMDDGLFGTCQKANQGLIPDFYQYELTAAQRQELESILVALIESGFDWSHAYTQCVIWNVLGAYRSGLTRYDITRCETAAASPSQQQLDQRQSEYDDDVIPDDDDVIADAYDAQNGDINFARRGGGAELGEEWGLGRAAGGEGSDGVQGPTVEEFEQFLGGLSDRDLKDLERYVADDLTSNQQEEQGLDAAETYPDVPDYGSPSRYNDYRDDLYDESLIDKKGDYLTSSSIDKYNNYYARGQPAMQTRVVVNYDPDGKADTGTADTDESNAAATNNKQQPAISDSQPRTKPDVSAPSAAVPKPSAAVSSSTSQQQPARPSVGRLQAQTGTSNRQPSNQANSNYGGVAYEPVEKSKPMGGRRYVLTMYVLCGLVGGITLAAVAIYLVRRRRLLQDKLTNWVTTSGSSQQPSDAYQDLCRQHMQAKFSEKTEPVHLGGSRVEKSSTVGGHDEKTAAVRTGSTGSSTSSWTEEPVTSNLDISTGHIVLAYMEDHLKNKDRLLKEWETLSAYDPEPCSIVAAIEPTNMRKNRYTDILPYEHSRVKLHVASNVSNSDFINASTIMDHDPRNPAYIATQGPLPHTVADFWQMIWEQGSIVIVNLTRLAENGINVCHRYWPEEGSDLYHIYEVHLVSEHVWCEDYVIRSFYLKNLQTNETRTVTQFHFVAWANNDVPATPKSLLDFRRKVNKSFRCRSNPIVVHCSDGAGRTGTYCLIDMVLNRLSKGAKEIDIAATLEHIRDQRINMVRTKEQFEFALTAVAHEVQAILHAPT